MNKKDILLFGMMLEADIYVDGIGTTEGDEELIKKALFKVYGATESSTEEQLEKLQEELEQDNKLLVIEYREKIKQYLGI